MNKVLLITTFVLYTISAVYARTITDMAGRNVTVPDKIDRVFPYDAKSSMLIFPIVGEKMVATAMLPGKKNIKYISKAYTELPDVDVKNIEEVLSYSPQVIIAGFYTKNDKNESVFSLGKRLSIPVVLIDLSIDRMDKTYLFLGKMFYVDSQPYVDFIQMMYKDIELLKTTHGAVTSTVYYTLGSNGLLTDPSGSKHTEVFDFLSIPNAAKVEIPSGGHAEVNLEQVLLWNPDYIFTSAFRSENSAYGIITTDSKWKSIKAVKNNRVYKVPSQPMEWFDHPPSINRVPGLIWLCEVFYNVDAKETEASIIRFYSLFYNYQLSSAEYNSLFE